MQRGMLAEALRQVAVMASRYPGEGYGDRVDALRTELRYMTDFLLRGYKDDSRATLYADLLQRTAELDYDLRVRSTLCENHYVRVSLKSLGTEPRDFASLQSALIDPSGPKDHYDSLSKAFLSLLVSNHWRQQQQEEWAVFLASPHTSPFDACALIGAIMLSSFYNYSYHKALCLANVWLTAQSEMVRQRAFVCCLLSMYAQQEADQESADKVMAVLMSVPDAGKTLIETQMQMELCAKAEADSTEINKSIMPELLRNHPLKFTKDGIMEKEEESDSVDINADERRMEAMEGGIKRMMQMQKNGSDIFFGGFRQMKRFPFFSKLANWFVPFTVEHPDIAREVATIKNSDFIERVTRRGPFCDSDKYSFVIAMSSVMGQLPENVRKMMEQGEVGPLGMGSDELGLPEASVLRLQCLQDLYRFFRLNGVLTTQSNPFAGSGTVWPLRLAVNHLSDADRKAVCTNLLRASYSNVADDLVAAFVAGFKDTESVDCVSMKAELALRGKRHAEAAELFAQCLKQKPRDAALMRGVARACYGMGSYARAAFYFDALHTMFPTRKSYAINYAMSMVKDGKADAVVNDMYRLEYENPSDLTVKNALGWVLLSAGKAEQALAVYEKLSGAKEMQSDFQLALNAFYAYMANGRVTEGLDVLRTHAATLDGGAKESFTQSLYDAITEDFTMLAPYGFGVAERGIIISQLESGKE